MRSLPNRHVAARLMLAATMLCAWDAAAHADPIGQVVEVAQNAFADNAGTKRDLASGADVAALEVISTDKIGKAALRFADDTRLSIGPGAAVVLDRFVYDPEKSTSAFVIKATKGAFRFSTGRGDHNAYRIETPTASIGVRGTEFDVIIGEKSVRISMRSGLVNVCPNGSTGGGGCADARKGQSVIAEPGRARTVPTKSLPAVRLALLPLPPTVLPKALAGVPRPTATSLPVTAKDARAKTTKLGDPSQLGRRAAAALARRGETTSRALARATRKAAAAEARATKQTATAEAKMTRRAAAAAKSARATTADRKLKATAKTNVTQPVRPALASQTDAPRRVVPATAKAANVPPVRLLRRPLETQTPTR